MTLAEFKENYPNIPLEALANAEGIKSEYLKEMIVGQPAFFAGYDKVVAAECRHIEGFDGVGRHQ